MSESYCVVLEFYNHNVLVASEYVEAKNLCEICEHFVLANCDKLVVSGYYIEKPAEEEVDEDSEDSLIIEFQ